LTDFRLPFCGFSPRSDWFAIIADLAANYQAGWKRLLPLLKLCVVAADE
jgi:hypothetical protein